MFTKDNKLENFKNAETIIGSSIKVKGNFNGQGNVLIEGVLEGSLKTDADLFIGEKAKVVANIESENAIINGEIKGNLKIKNFLSLGPTAKIFGDVQYSEISIEKGGIINGQIIYSQDNGKKSSVNKLEIKNEKTDDSQE
jgi:cytoskeletal protein CcmA (bactofilin family)